MWGNNPKPLPRIIRRFLRVGITWGSVPLLGAVLLSPALSTGSDSMPTDTRPAVGKKIFSFAEIVRDEKKAIVNLSAWGPRLSEKGSPSPFRSPLEDVFGGPEPGSDAFSLGSGFLIKKEGLILTNHHVVDRESKIRVRLWDGREFPAEVIGRDAQSDIALLRIRGSESFPVVRLGDSDRLEVGEWVAAIGNPFGSDPTVTVGIVSGKGRAIGNGPYDDFLQTDASINPGNSGGPLLNIRGEVVGINTAVNPSGQGIGFAIPINQVKPYLDQLEQDGRITRGWLGVMIQDPPGEAGETFETPRARGALISDVFEGGPADRAGLRRGDVIIEFDGKRVDRMRKLPAAVAGTPVGKEVLIKTIRDGREMKTLITIGRLQESEGK